MIQHSALFEEASRFSYTTDTRVDIYNSGVLMYPNVPLIDGKVTCDRGSKVRWSADFTLGMAAWETYPLISKEVSRFKIYRGITSIGKTEVLQLGEYRIDDLSRSEQGQMSISGSGLESYLIDARFIRPVQPFQGMGTVAAIRLLVSEGIPGYGATRLKALNTKDKLVTDRAPWARERLDTINKLAESIGAEFFIDNTGTARLVDIPDLTKTTPVYMVNEGKGGVLVSQNVQSTRDKVYNAISVTGNNGEVWAVALDNNPASQTYFYGGFGQKPKFYTSQYLYTFDQCEKLAARMLAENLAASKSLSFTTAPLSFLEAGDVVHVRLADQTTEKHLLQSLSSGLGIDGTMSAETFTVSTNDGVS